MAPRESACPRRGGFSMRRGRWMSHSAVFMASLVVAWLAWGAVAGGVSAAEFTQAEVFFELNDTDGDLGLHAAIDGGPYVALEVEDAGGRALFKRTGQRRLAQQGRTHR